MEPQNLNSVALILPVASRIWRRKGGGGEEKNQVMRTEKYLDEL
jgi:hypothetical protein